MTFRIFFISYRLNTSNIFLGLANAAPWGFFKIRPLYFYNLTTTRGVIFSFLTETWGKKYWHNKKSPPKIWWIDTIFCSQKAWTWGLSTRVFLQLCKAKKGELFSKHYFRVIYLVCRILMNYSDNEQSEHFLKDNALSAFSQKKGELSKQVNTTRRSTKTHKECSFFLVGATFWTNLQVFYVILFSF